MPEEIARCPSIQTKQICHFHCTIWASAQKKPWVRAPADLCDFVPMAEHLLFDLNQSFYWSVQFRSLVDVDVFV